MTPGAAGMYCGSCTRDIAHARHLRLLGHDVTVMPLYTPLQTDSFEEIDQAPLFLGGLNVYLQQVLGLFRHLPASLDRLLDRPRLLKFLGRRGISTAPAKLGRLTLSVLQGQEGRQFKELVRIADYLDSVPAYDVIHLSNALLSGMAPYLRSRFPQSRFCCSVQGEDTFLERMGPETYREGRRLIRKNAKSIDVFFAAGKSYARAMIEFLSIPTKRMHVLPSSVEFELLQPLPERKRQPFTVGYLSLILAPKGLDLLIEAIYHLRTQQDVDARLEIAGDIGDKAFWKTVRHRIRLLALEPYVHYHGVLSREEKVRFLHSLSAFVLPSRLAESRGLAALEALAVGLPAILPAKGVFPEMAEQFGGMLLFSPENHLSMASQLYALADDPAEADALGQAARQQVRELCSPRLAAESLLAGYAALPGG